MAYLSRFALGSGDAPEEFVEGQIVSHGVLPTGVSCPEVGIDTKDGRVNLIQGQSLIGRLLYRRYYDLSVGMRGFVGGVVCLWGEERVPRVQGRRSLFGTRFQAGAVETAAAVVRLLLDWLLVSRKAD